MDECCRVLKETKEYDTDASIESIMRVQDLLQQILLVPETLYSGGDLLLETVIRYDRSFSVRAEPDVFLCPEVNDITLFTSKG